MNARKQDITLDVAARTIAGVSVAQAMAKLDKYARMDTGVLAVALRHGNELYFADSTRPAHPCEVWVVAGQQLISYHGEECDAAYASACVMVLGLRVARLAQEMGMGAPQSRPWLDTLSLVMLYAGRPERGGAPLPVARALYERVEKHGVDMSCFTMVDNEDEHF